MKFDEEKHKKQHKLAVAGSFSDLIISFCRTNYDPKYALTTMLQGKFDVAEIVGSNRLFSGYQKNQ
jgi:hypothetical protein